MGRKRKVTVQVIQADHKDVDGLVRQFCETMESFGLHVLAHPIMEGTDTYSFLVSDKELEKVELDFWVEAAYTPTPDLLDFNF